MDFRKKDFSKFDHKSPSKSPRNKEKALKFCSNDSIAKTYVTEVLSIIANIESNSTYDSIIKNRPNNLFEFLKDKTNQELLQTNCENFLQGLKLAKKADKEYEQTQRKLTRNIQKQLKEVAKNVNNGKGFYELDI